MNLEVSRVKYYDLYHENQDLNANWMLPCIHMSNLAQEINMSMREILYIIVIKLMITAWTVIKLHLPHVATNYIIPN